MLNINDHSPQFIGTPYRVSINDTEALGSLVFNVMATDADVGPDGNITYSIFDGNTGEMFWINPLVRFFVLFWSPGRGDWLEH